MTVRIVDSPLGDYANTVGCWSHVRDDLLAGRMSDTLSVRYFIAEIEGEVVGSMGCYVPSGTRDVGLVEFVETDERHRRKGIASTLLDRLITDFRSDSGKALLLCTTNPIAGSLYEKQGFWYTVGDGMMYVSPDAQGFADDYLSYVGSAKVREAVWGDLPRASLLYNNPETGLANKRLPDGQLPGYTLRAPLHATNAWFRRRTRSCPRSRNPNEQRGRPRRFPPNRLVLRTARGCVHFPSLPCLLPTSRRPASALTSKGGGAVNSYTSGPCC